MRININYELDEKTINWVIESNKIIGSVSALEAVDFQNNPIRPHITLLMGEVNENNLDKVVKLVQDSSLAKNTHKVKLNKPFLCDNYIMASVCGESSEVLINECQQLVKILGKMIEPSKHTMTKQEPAHVTLAYVLEPEKIEKWGVKNIKPLTSTVTLSNLTVSLAGKHGIVYKN